MWVETDSLSTASLLKSHDTSLHPLGHLLGDCRVLMGCLREVRIGHALVLSDGELGKEWKLFIHALSIY